MRYPDRGRVCLCFPLGDEGFLTVLDKDFTKCSRNENLLGYESFVRFLEATEIPTFYAKELS